MAPTSGQDTGRGKGPRCGTQKVRFMVNETATNSHAQSKMIRCKYELRRCIKWETNKKTPATHHKWLLWRYGACTLFPPGIACYLKELGTLGLSRHAQTVKRKSSYLLPWHAAHHICATSGPFSICVFHVDLQLSTGCHMNCSMASTWLPI